MKAYYLPFPPSANVYWRMDKRFGRMYPSAKAKKYRKEIQKQMRSVAFGSVRLQVSMMLHAPTKRKYDIDNRIKVLLDALEFAGVFNDDEQVDKLVVERGRVRPEDDGVLVVIERIRSANLPTSRRLPKKPAKSGPSKTRKAKARGSRAPSHKRYRSGGGLS